MVSLRSADRCPGVLRLHAAADGQLARVRVPGGRIDAAGLRALADVAALGNGICELTSRASVQLRGLPEGCEETVWGLLAEAGLVRSDTHERVRNIVAGPLADAHADAVVGALDDELCADPALAELSGRFLFAVEDGSGTLGAHRADVTLTRAGGRRWRVNGGPGAVDAVTAVALALDVARAGRAESAPPACTRELLGTSADQAGTVAITGLAPLGRVGGETLSGLAEQFGEVRISPRRTISIRHVLPARAARVSMALRALGLVTDPDSGWNGLTACAGEGACARARFDVRAAAARRAAQRGSGSPVEHWAGCERHCGKPADAEVCHDVRP